MDVQAIGFLCTLGLFPLLATVAPALNRQAAQARAFRTTWLLENPQALTWVQLVKNQGYPAHLEVKTAGGQREGISGCSGDAAVRQFEQLCANTPHAAHVVSTNGINEVVTGTVAG